MGMFSKKGGFLSKAVGAATTTATGGAWSSDGKSGLAQGGSGVLSNFGVKGGIGGLKDVLLGRKDKGVADRYLALDPLQKDALGKYGDQLNVNTDQMAKNAVAGQERMIQTGAADAERNASKLIAQRGLGNSSVGLNALINTQRNTGDQINNVRAQLPGMQYDMKTKNLDNATSGIQNILNNRMFIQGRQGGGRTGGLAPLIGAGLGAAMAPPGGQAAGAQMGMGLGNAFTQMG